MSLKHLGIQLTIIYLIYKSTGGIDMASWEQFEIDCTNFLNNNFGQYAHFIHEGGSDSTVPDILVQADNGARFYIEAKHSPAQCGQFVLLPNIKSMEFEYSAQNANRINHYAKLIMQYMNSDFDAFREAGTSGRQINMTNSTTVFPGWIKEAYRDKGVKFFISNDYQIVPLDEIEDFFDFSATYRIKRSGSSAVGKPRISSVKEYLQNVDFVIDDIKSDGQKLYVFSSESLHNRRFILEGYEYMLSQRGNAYEIRKLSNTYNANVIFSIFLKSNPIQNRADSLIAALT